MRLLEKRRARKKLRREQRAERDRDDAQAQRDQSMLARFDQARHRTQPTVDDKPAPGAMLGGVPVE